MEKVKITIETVLERHEVEIPANHYRKIKLRLFDMLLDDSNGEPLMDIQKQFEKETGQYANMSAGSVISWNANYVEWLELKLKQSNIRTMDNPDQEEGKRPERPDDDEG